MKMAKRLWQPSGERIKSTNMYRFMNFINEKHGRDFKDYDSLYRWSVSDIPDFWAALWDFVGIKSMI
jgi:acetoacetyl-CoA synthetase